MSRLRLSAFAIAFACAAASAATPPLPPFTAHYRLSQNGSPIGTATLTLAPGNSGTWTFTTISRGTAGLASLLDASTRETSTFSWVGDLPQGESYDYSLETAFKHKHRSVRFDWNTHTIEVIDKGTYRFPTRPGALERHTVPLALAAGLSAGLHDFTLPVAVRDRIEMQHYAVQGEQTLQVPAGSFDTTEVTRTDGGAGIEAWFAPTRLPAPVKIEQSGKDEITLELQSWSKP
jgi:Protein of unknown function (DUF3108)